MSTVEGSENIRIRSQHITNGSSSAGETKRILLDNVKEIKHLRNKLEKFVSELFGKELMEEFNFRTRNKGDEATSHIERFVVCGLDVMVDTNEKFYVLEVNRNPGAPPLSSLNEKGDSGEGNSFKLHLIQFAKDLYKQLSLEIPETSDGFVKISSS
eukprot:g6991.t1